MGGHGGLNILPQKRWNVYNYDNREKVRRDEEAAARDEQLKRDDARKRDAELRLEKLRQARGLASDFVNEAAAPSSSSNSKSKSKSEETRLENDSNHINLFEGIRIFDPIEAKPESKDQRPIKKVKKEQPPRVVTAEDEKYKLGYGIVGKGTKLPWYMEKPTKKSDEKSDDDDDDLQPAKKKSNGKKTVEELRKERLEREKREKQRERALLKEKSGRDGGFSRR